MTSPQPIIVRRRPRIFLVIGICGMLALALVFQPAQGDPTRGAGSCATGTGRLTVEELQSSVLHALIPVLVYLPPCYRVDAPQRYPVLYLLHGAGADETQWDDVGIDEAADQLITNRAISPLIMVFPGGGRSGESAYNRFVVDELIPFVDVSFATRAQRDARAIGGISMGGRGAIIIAATHPGLFGSVGGHSPALGGDEPLAGLRRLPIRIWLDVGDEDGLARAADRFRQQLDRADLPVIWRAWPGEHNRAYWRAHTADYLRFYTAPWASQPDAEQEIRS